MDTKRTVETILFGGRDGTRSRNSIGLRAHSLHGAELNQPLEQSRLACCGYIIAQKIKKHLLKEMFSANGSRKIIHSYSY